MNRAVLLHEAGAPLLGDDTLRALGVAGEERVCADLDACQTPRPRCPLEKASVAPALEVP